MTKVKKRGISGAKRQKNHIFHQKITFFIKKVHFFSKKFGSFKKVRTFAIPNEKNRVTKCGNSSVGRA